MNEVTQCDLKREDIIRLARHSGLVGLEQGGILENFQCFAALVAAAEREAIGNIILDYAGRDDLSDSDESLLKHLFELIRARGET